MAITIEISETKQAEATDQPADPDVKLLPSADGITIKDACGSNGFLRKITVNGICYNQICCGGQWLFVVNTATNTYCTCNLNQSWTVNCGGNNLMIRCGP